MATNNLWKVFGLLGLGAATGTLFTAMFGGQKFQESRIKAEAKKEAFKEAEKSKAQEVVEKQKRINEMEIKEKERTLEEKRKHDEWILAKKQQRIEDINSQLVEITNSGIHTEADVILIQSLRKEQLMLLGVDMEIEGKKELFNKLEDMSKTIIEANVSQKNILRNIADTLQNIEMQNMLKNTEK